MTETTLSSVDYQLLSINIIVNCVHCNSRKQGIFGSAATLGGRYFWDSTVFIFLFICSFVGSKPFINGIKMVFTP